MPQLSGVGLKLDRIISQSVGPLQCHRKSYQKRRDFSALVPAFPDFEVLTRPPGALQKSYAYTYDLAGRLTALSDSAGNDIANGYDTAGRQTSAATTIAGLSGARTIGYTLDANGNRTQSHKNFQLLPCI